MNTETNLESLDRNLVKKHKKRLSPQLRNLTISGLIGGALISAIFFAGYRFGHIEPAPANKECRNFALSVPAFYQAKLNEVFGTAIPDGTITKDQLKELATNCDTNIDIYTFRLKEEVKK